MTRRVVVLVAHGARVRLSAEEGQLDQVLGRLAPSVVTVPCRDGHDGGPIDVDGSVDVDRPEGTWVVRSSELGETAARGEDDAIRITASQAQLGLAAHAREAVYIHAGAVAWKGRGIVVPGRSLAGKTTLVSALVRAGASYYSDEYAVLRPDGTLEPFTKPLAVRRDDTTVAVPPRELGRIGTDPVPVALVAALRYAPGSSPEVTTASGSAAVLALVDNAVAARVRPEAVLAAAVAVGRTARFVTGERGDADTVVQDLLRLAEQR